MDASTQVRIIIDLFLNTKKNCCVPLVKSRDGIIILDSFSETIYILLFYVFDQNLENK
jgi:hypothetical protein